ncbi:MAG TPA: hypothetical protein VFA26_24315, partial [Gemmataceae bacterium]|nr:hypothetical protein [Gemmataceae bacterium]
VAARADGLYRYTDQGQQAQPPLLFLKLPPKKGGAWKFDFKLGGQQVKGGLVLDEEEVTVPAGKYKAVVVETKDAEGPATLKPQAKWWYAPGVGLVKQQMKVGDAEATFELEKFEPGK